MIAGTVKQRPATARLKTMAIPKAKNISRSNGKLWSDRQKDRGVKLVLGWWRDRWRKRIPQLNGQIKYFVFENSEEGYAEALEAYYHLIRQLSPKKPNQAVYEHCLPILRQMMEWYARFGVPEGEEPTHDRLADVVASAEKELEQQKLRPFMELVGYDTSNERRFLDEVGLISTEPSHSAYWFRPWRIGDEPEPLIDWQPAGKWTERIQQLDRGSRKTTGKGTQAVGFQIRRFFDFKAAQVAGDHRAIATFGTLKERLTQFERWVGSGVHVKEINGTTLRDYYKFLLTRPVGNIRRRNLFNAAKQWIRWAWKQDDVELETLPKAMNDDDLKFLTHLNREGEETEVSENLLFTPDEIIVMTSGLPLRWRCCVALCLNCGFTQIDLANLKKDQIDLEERRLVFKRTKTKRHKSPPKVNYKLWSVTVELLKEAISDDPVYVFVTKNGNKLMTETLVDGKVKRWDTVGSAWRKMQQRSRVPNKPIKYLRKTGSNWLKYHDEFSSLQQTYLAQAHTTVADKHYTAHSGKPHPLFDRAIDALGKHFGMT
jgi:integrase